LKRLVGDYGLAYKGIEELRGSLLMVKGITDVRYDEMVKVTAPDGIARIGRVLEVGRGAAVIQLFGGEMGLEKDSFIEFTGSTFKIPVSTEALGRTFDGLFKPRDHAANIIGEMRDINGAPINPIARVYPNDYIQTGVSAIDGMLSLVRGQKLPIFSESGLPHNRLAAQIARQATILGKEEEFAVVFAALGLKNEEASFFLKQFKDSGALAKSAVILNLADDPPIERLFTPRIALTVAEHLAFDEGMHVLAILSDMTNYAETLRRISAAREEMPGRKGYPTYLYSDLSSIYERAGIIHGKKGSLTQIPILTMPGGDLHHPVPDLSGYITEGQVILDKGVEARGIYPPINVLPSLSRLMRKGIGVGKTREDHADVSNQLYDSYSKSVDARDLVRVVGEIGLSDTEKKYLKFGEIFEKKFLNQGEFENRTIESTLELAWEVLSLLPEDEMIRIDEKFIRKYHPSYKGK